MRRILLDTNAYSALMAGNVDVLDALADADAVLMSAVVLGELFAGFKGGAKEEWNRDLLREFMLRPTVQVVDVTMATAEIFGLVKDRLKQAGKQIPINDVWIAAHAVETGSWLVTFDRHFADVSGVMVWDSVR